MRTVRSILIVLAITSSTSFADIVGGDDVLPTDPIKSSTAALYDPSPDGRGGALCTASLIGPDTAITAAHCVSSHGPKPMMIFGNDARSPQSTRLPVTQVAVNPRWRSHQGRGMDQGDIALVKFKGAVPDGYHPVDIIQDESAIKKGGAAVLAGYGISDAKRHTGAGVLRKTVVRVADARPGKSEMVLDQSHGHGACHGDSGGPAFIRRGGRAILAGVTNRSYPDSAPDDCAHKVVYTKVSAYRPWINQTEKRFHEKREPSTPSLAQYSLRSSRQRIAHRIQGKAGRQMAKSHVASSERRSARSAHRHRKG